MAEESTPLLGIRNHVGSTETSGNYSQPLLSLTSSWRARTHMRMAETDGSTDPGNVTPWHCAPVSNSLLHDVMIWNTGKTKTVKEKEKVQQERYPEEESPADNLYPSYLLILILEWAVSIVDLIRG